jgi:sugar/nucleoside kinase (ribokinase family)
MTSPLLVVGSVAFDTVRTPFGSGEEVLGGSATYFSMAASFFTSVHLVAAVGEDFKDSDAAPLRERGVDLAGLTRIPGRTFRWEGEYGYDLNTAKTLRTELGVFATFRPKLAEPLRESAFVFLANIDPEIQTEVLDQVTKPRFVACDTMNFWIEGKLEALRKTLSRVDALLINDAEARQLAGEPNLVRAAAAIRRMGPSTVVVKRGEYGAIMFSEEGVFSVPAYPLESVLDPTGAGDSFAGGFMGHLARSGRLTVEGFRQAVVLGSVMASLNVEDFSLRRLARTREDEIRARYRDFQDLTGFAELA